MDSVDNAHMSDGDDFDLPDSISSDPEDSTADEDATSGTTTVKCSPPKKRRRIMGRPAGGIALRGSPPQASHEVLFAVSSHHC